MGKHLLLNITTNCNAACPFCLVFDKLNKPELNMTDEQVYAMLRRGREEGYTEVGYTGGEPTAHKGILETMAFAKALGYEYQAMNTNGIRFKHEKFCRESLEAGLSSIDISIHGHTADLHDRLVAKEGAFQAIVDACGHLGKLKSEFSFHLSATVVITRDNHAMLREICEFLHSLGFTNIRMKYAYEGHLTREALIDQVAPYETIVADLKRAIDYLANTRGGFHHTHVPHCLMGEYAVFSRDYETESIKMGHHDGEEVGIPELRYRTDGGECRTCAVQHLCTRLDGAYEQFHGRPPLKAYATIEDFRRQFDEALVRFPRARNLIERGRKRFLEHADRVVREWERVQTSSAEATR